MATSGLREKPAGRLDTDTRALPLSRLDEVARGLARVMVSGGKAYWVCPLIEESEQSDLAAASERHVMLRRLYGDTVGLLHGQMDSADKDAAIEDFIRDRTSILVSTTVIEVGVNVPTASVMVIEHAERFGLAQLHQLRGRVGRGNQQGVCLLLYQHPLSQTAASRLEILRRTNDGFVIAEEDLKLRGAGEMLGTRQSGAPVYRIADWHAHQDLLKAAHADADAILKNDPRLLDSRGQALRLLLALFEQDQAMRYLHA
jgi:ATP-dependent DNA helicase RecG